MTQHGANYCGKIRINVTLEFFLAQVNLCQTADFNGLTCLKTSKNFVIFLEDGQHILNGYNNIRLRYARNVTKGQARY